MRKEDICDCLVEEDRGWLLIALDEAIRHEEEDIVHARRGEERAQMLIRDEKKGSDMHAFYKDTMNIAESVIKLHQKQITSYKTVRTRVENTMVCK